MVASHQFFAGLTQVLSMRKLMIVNMDPSSHNPHPTRASNVPSVHFQAHAWMGMLVPAQPWFVEVGVVWSVPLVSVAYRQSWIGTTFQAITESEFKTYNP
jgi:hypothetical protein